MPESFNVLVKEIRSLGIDIELRSRLTDAVDDALSDARDMQTKVAHERLARPVQAVHARMSISMPSRSAWPRPEKIRSLVVSAK
jgi:hypothetical protein